MVGASGSLVLLGFTYVLTEWMMWFYMVSYAIGFVLSVVNNYLWNTLWTFKDKLSWLSLLKYLVIGGITLGLNLCIVWILTEKVGIWYLLSAIIGIGTAFIINFMLSKGIVWNKNE